MVTVVAFEFGVMRCQPLRRALYFYLSHLFVCIAFH
ncbi:acetyltransferase [Vibrio cholerae]|nr:acetyltransferase [Vibrio cholerae]EGR5456747.1 acetyltransferase [Vibrio cholerae]EGR5464569.1 acetyltransferase [Vibrio cholerae]EKN8283695.1 acetyltransferase [Vibrio cholerae]